MFLVKKVQVVLFVLRWLPFLRVCDFAGCLEFVLRCHLQTALWGGQGIFFLRRVTWLCWILTKWQDSFIKVMCQIFKPVQTKKLWQQNFYLSKWLFPDSLIFSKNVGTHEGFFERFLRDQSLLPLRLSNKGKQRKKTTKQDLVGIEDHRRTNYI